MDEFAPHWLAANAALAPAALIISMPDKTPMTQAQFAGLRELLLAAQADVQDALNDEQIARGGIDLKKAQLLKWLNEFNGFLDAYYVPTKYYQARPLVPGIGDGPDRFLTPMRDALSLWIKLDDAPAPAGLTLPLTLADGTVATAFSAVIGELEEAYKTEGSAGVSLKLARAGRNEIQVRAYDAMKMYRQAIPPRLAQHPTIIATLPILTPAPGHTPAPVNASALFEAPDQAKVAYEASEDADLHSYQLRGTVGDEYNADDAVVIATNAPGAPREFVTGFGLTQAGAKIALRVFVVLTTGNESGSATMVVTRPS